LIFERRQGVAAETIMTIDWAHFTPGPALAGGALIGLAATILILGAGRIMGAAGILGGTLAIRPDDTGWRLALIAGLLLAPTLMTLIGVADRPHFDASWPVLIVGGLLVGFGTRLASGCTSGHGICGLARLSPRSLIATGLFMATGFATVFIVRHVIG
jgi:uncharacterized membrane protein YedE/YeeE